MNKGLLWRLKDNAHHLFRSAEEYSPTGMMLDWTLGYIFHESLKLMEDAHQLQYYVPRLSGFFNGELPSQVTHLSSALFEIRGETLESMQRESVRIEKLFSLTRRLFIFYFRGKAEHRLLARFLYDCGEQVRAVFGAEYSEFLASVYGEAFELMYIEAGYSLLESGRYAEALAAATAAAKLNPSSAVNLLAQIPPEAVEHSGALPS